MKDLVLPTPDGDGKIYITASELKQKLVDTGMTQHTFLAVMAPQMGLKITYIGPCAGNDQLYCIEKWRS